MFHGHFRDSTANFFLPKWLSMRKLAEKNGGDAKQAYCHKRRREREKERRSWNGLKKRIIRTKRMLKTAEIAKHDSGCKSTMCLVVPRVNMEKSPLSNTTSSPSWTRGIFLLMHFEKRSGGTNEGGGGLSVGGCSGSNICGRVSLNVFKPPPSSVGLKKYL